MDIFKIVTIILIILLFISVCILVGYKIYNHFTPKYDKIMNIQGSSSSVVPNDIIKYTYDVKSDPFPSTQEGYNLILPVLDDFQDILSSIDNTIKKNTRINYYTNQSYENGNPNGYVSGATITYEINIFDENNKNIASRVQDDIMNIASDDVNILLRNIEYSVSESLKNDYINDTIVDAIENAKMNARQLTTATYGKNARYVIIDTTAQVSDNSNSPILFRQSAELDTSPMEQGSSTIQANVNMKIRVR